MIAALDIVVAILLLAGGLLGLWRGLAREAMAMAGIWLAISITNEWAAGLAATLADALSVAGSRLEPVVTIGLFLSVVLVLGYGGAVLLPPHRPGRTHRLLGLVAGVANGALLLGYGLTLARERLASAWWVSLGGESVVVTIVLALASVAVLVPVATLTPIVLGTMLARLMGGAPATALVAPEAEEWLGPATATTAPLPPVEAPRRPPTPARPDPAADYTRPLPTLSAPSRRRPFDSRSSGGD